MVFLSVVRRQFKLTFSKWILTGYWLTNLLSWWLNLFHLLQNVLLMGKRSIPRRFWINHFSFLSKIGNFHTLPQISIVVFLLNTLKMTFGIVNNITMANNTRNIMIALRIWSWRQIFAFLFVSFLLHSLISFLIDSLPSCRRFHRWNVNQLSIVNLVHASFQTAC